MSNPRICFLIGSMAISGGTYVIIQHANYLRSAGFDVTLAVQEAFTAATLSWHDQASQLHCIPIEQAKSEEFDLVIATWWKTAFELGNFKAKHYAYFVQSIESRFYPETDVPLRALVDATYKFPVHFLTEAGWIKEYLAEKYGKTSALVRNGIRKDVYKTVGTAISDRPKKQPRVLIEGHFGVKFKNTALALRLAREAGARDIWVLTGSPVRWVPGASRVFSRVPMMETADIYRSCDILVKLSTVEGMFGPPLEIFHCGGTSIVYDVTGHDEYIVDAHNARVVKRGDADGVVAAMKTLLTDAAALEKLKKGAIQTAEKWPSWEAASAEFMAWVNSVLGEKEGDAEILRTLSAQAFSEYVTDEQEHLRNNPGIVRRHKISAIAAKFPPAFTRAVKQMETVAEIVLQGRKTY